MLKTGRSGQTSRLRLAALAAVAVAISVTSAQADPIVFAPNGTGPGATVDSFVNADGNSLAIGAQAAIAAVLGPGGTGTGPSAPFLTVFQAAVASIRDSANNPVFAPGLPGTNNLSVTLGFFERAIVTAAGSTPGSGTISLTAQGLSQAGSFFEIYSHAASANDDTGLGFRNGTLILKATAVPNSVSGSFSGLTTQPTPLPPLDSHTGDNGALAGAPDSTPTVVGSGGSGLNFTVTSVDPAYFPAGLGSLITLFFNTTNNTPFVQTEPSDRFYDTANPALVGSTGLIAPTYTPLLGAINGAGTGPDFQIQTTSTFNFTTAAVPEPGSISLALTGIGLTSLAALRQRRFAGRSAA
jgi:hypothetical protein